MGLWVDWETPEGRAGLLECLKAHRQACEDTMRRDAGEVVETPPEAPLAPAPAPAAAAKGHTAKDAFDAWKTAKPGRPRKTEATYEAAADKLAVLMGGKTLEELTRADGRAITAGLLEEAAEKGGSAQNTAANLLGRFKTLLAQAVDLEWIARNPLDARTIERVKRMRKPWLPAELVTLFDDPLFNAYDVPRAAAAGKDAAYWLPLLGLFTGARISELAQMHTDDVSHLHEAGWVLSIEEDAEEGQRVKNVHSIRTVPVHPELVRLGFIDYWKAIKAHGSGALWPAIVRTELNGAGGKVSQWFGAYKKAKGFGPEHVFHSFRHTLETQLRALSVPKYHIGAITGHAGEDVSDDYAHPTPAVLRPVLERLQFPELSLPRVFAVPAWQPAR